MRASDTDSGDDEWFGQGMAHMVLWIPCRNPGVDGAWELGHVLGKEYVNGVQGLGHGARESGRMWRGRTVCKGRLA